jgi:hypothetical protein
LAIYAPGQVLWSGSTSALPRAFARVATSLLVSSVTILVLVALDSFSLPRFVAVSGAITLLGYLGLARAREPDSRPASATRGRYAGVLVFAAALAAYWPPFEAHFAASDASAYLAAGVQLARYHTLEKPDELGPLVPPVARNFLFFSTLGSPWKPPYSRMHGGMVVDTPGAATAYPSFFPLPSAWSGLFSDALGARYGGGYAGLFGAAAVWAAYLLARARLGTSAALVVAGLTAANAASYWAGRMALAEPLAWFFLCAAMVALDAFEEEGSPSDARLAGALLGATALARVEYAGFVLVALLARAALRPTLVGTRALTWGFVLTLGAMLAVVGLEVGLVRGAYTVPLVEAWRGIEWIVRTRWIDAPWTIVLGAVAVTLAYAGAARRLGLVRATAAAGVVTFAGLYWRLSPDFSPPRVIGWLAAYLGWATLALALAGGVVVWRARAARPADGFLLLLLGVVGGCLVIDPHVMPAMPWASRRFVPIVVPGLLLLAGMACAALRRRSVVIGVAAYLVLAVSVLAPARAMWKHDYYAGTYDQLRELVATLPPDGALMIDNRLVPMLLGPPLWLAHGRNSLPAVASTPAGRATIAGMTHILEAAGKGPVHLIKPTLVAAPEPIFFVRSTQVADFTLQIALPEQTDGPPPKRVEKYTQSISVFRLEK